VGLKDRIHHSSAGLSGGEQLSYTAEGIDCVFLDINIRER
jgi:hypothetical protein